MSVEIGNGSAWEAHLKGACVEACHYCKQNPVKKNTSAPELLPVEAKSASITFTDTSDGNFELLMVFHPGDPDENSPAHKVAFQVRSILNKLYEHGEETVGIIGLKGPESIVDQANDFDAQANVPMKPTLVQ